MIIKFDVFGEAKIPKITLHNPNGQQVGIISEFKDMEIAINLMELSTLSFSVPHNSLFYDEVFDKLKRPRIVKVEGIGQFIIEEPLETNDGITRWKHIQCNSLEYELSRVTVRIPEGVYKFYDVIDPTDTILGRVMSYLPNWKLGSVDSDLWNIKRMFNDTTETAYSMLVGSVSETFKCVFRFNTMDRTISVKKYENITKNTDIVVGYSNLVKNLEIGESPDGMFTCLGVVGAGDISINEVNPLGTSKIYNYDYYLTHTDKDGQYLMSGDLRNAVTAWKAKIANNTQTYKNIISNIKTTNTELITLNQQLVTLKSEYTTLETLYTVKVEQGESVSEVRQQMYAKESQIKVKESEVKSKESQLEGLMKQKIDINNALAIGNIENFSRVQQEELALFTNEDGYADEHLCVTDIMTENEKMEVYQELYDKAVGILAEVSQPVYSFSTSLVNYLMLGEYETFTQQTDLGCVIRLEIEKGRFAYPILLGYTLNFDKDKRNNVDMNWGSTLRLTNDANSIKKLLDKAVSGGNKIGLDSFKWNGYEKDKSAISEYMKGSLDASLQEIKNADNQEIVFGANGIIGRRSNGDGTYSPEAFWMMNNTWVMTDDDFQTAKLAIGKTLLPDGVTKAYGINSEVLVGKLIIGNQLHIENEDLSFRVDADGVTIKNGNILMTNGDGEDVDLGQFIVDETGYINNKIDNVLDAKTGEIRSDKIIGNIEAGKNNIDIINNTTTKAMKMNEAGILIANSKTGSNWNWKTAISADGIVAEAIKANGTLSGCHILGGDLNIGSGKFKVDSLGNVTASSMTITGGSISGTGINVNNKFVVDTAGNVTASNLTLTGGSINIADKFKVDSLGNVAMTGTISWGAGNSPVKTQYSPNNSSWHDSFQNGDLYVRYSYDGGVTWTAGMKFVGTNGTNGTDGKDGKDATLPEFIKETYIDGNSVSSPVLRGGLIEGATLRSVGTSISAIEVCNASRTKAGYIKYDENGSGSADNAKNRMFISTDNGYAMKLQSDADLSISAKGKIWSGSITLVAGAKIYNADGTEYGGSGVAVFG